MKRILSLALVTVMCLLLTSCVTSSVLTQRVTDWLTKPSVSEIVYEMGGISGTAIFEYRSERDNFILFASGEGLSGVKFTFSGDKVTASREADGIEWEIAPEMAEMLSVFGKLYSHASTLTYRTKSDAEAEEGVIANIFEYTDGECEIRFNKEDGRIRQITYTQGEETVKLTVNRIEALSAEHIAAE